MKDVEIDPAIQANPQLLAAVGRANELLRAELGRSSEGVSAAWRLVCDSQQRTLLRLTLSDWTGHVEADLAPEEFRSDWHLQGRLIRLWGDLLQVQSHKLIEGMQGAGAGREGH